MIRAWKPGLKPTGLYFGKAISDEAKDQDIKDRICKSYEFKDKVRFKFESLPSKPAQIEAAWRKFSTFGRPGEHAQAVLGLACEKLLGAATASANGGEPIYNAAYGDLLYVSGGIDNLILDNSPGTLLDYDGTPYLAISEPAELLSTRLFRGKNALLIAFRNNTFAGSATVYLYNVSNILFSNTLSIRKADMSEASKFPKSILAASACTSLGFDISVFSEMSSNSLDIAGLRKRALVRDKKQRDYEPHNSPTRARTRLVLGEPIRTFYSKKYGVPLDKVENVVLFNGMLMPRRLSIVCRKNVACISIGNYRDQVLEPLLVRTANGKIIGSELFAEKNAGKYPILRLGYHIIGKRIATEIATNLYKFIFKITRGIKPNDEDARAVLVLNQYSNFTRKAPEDMFPKIESLISVADMFKYDI